ncbi:uncharacterized protein LOC118436233 [Folsomia candida]|nr:uncharacterized protein LOC118436233 [Folsomia candida]
MPGTIGNFAMSPILDLREGSNYGVTIVIGASYIQGLFFSHLFTPNQEQKHHNFSIQAKFLEVMFEDLNISGNIDARPLSLHTLPSGNFSLTCNTSSRCGAQVTNFFVEGRGTPVYAFSSIDRRLYYYFSELEIDHLSFDELSLNFGDLRIDGKKFDVQKWNKHFKKRLFHDLSKPEVKLGFVDKVRQSINSFIRTYPIEVVDAFSSYRKCIYYLDG